MRRDRSDLRRVLPWLPWCCVLFLGCAPAASNAVPAPPRSQPPARPVDGVQPPASVATVELKHPRSRQAWLGVEIEDLPAGRAGVRVVRVLRGSPAAAGGLQAGDEILALGGAGLSAPADLTRA